MEFSMDLPQDWQLITVEELVNLGAIESPMDGNHGGIHPKSTDYVMDGVPFIMASDLLDGMVDFGSCVFISEYQASGLRKGFSKERDVLISHKATIGRTAIVQASKHDFIVLTPQVTYYRVKDPSRLYFKYLKYYFDSPFFQTIFSQWAGAGSTRSYLGITAQLKLPIVVPPIQVQLDIGDRLGNLDRGRNLKGKINQTLESLSQCLFQSWFVDFDPIRAKVAAITAGENPQQAAMIAISGKTNEALAQLPAAQYRQLAATADLFPSALIETEYGEIPEGWEWKALSEVTEVMTRGITPKYNEEGVTVINQKCIRNHTIDFNQVRFHDETIRSVDSKEVHLGDVLVNSTGVGTLGRLSVVRRLTGKTTVDTHVTIVRAKRSVVSNEYLGCYMVHNESLIQEMGEGSTGQTELKRAVLGEMNIPIAPTSVQALFSAHVKTYSHLIATNELEMQTLKQLRDSLLPKLLAGELMI